jgi:hypothetical protein
MQATISVDAGLPGGPLLQEGMRSRHALLQAQKHSCGLFNPTKMGTCFHTQNFITTATQSATAAVMAAVPV